MTLYSCRHSGDQYRITKFTTPDFNVESSYLCDATACDCPAGHRPTCRHREMLPKFLAREAVGTQWMYDYDRGGWVQVEPGFEIEPAPLCVAKAMGEEWCVGNCRDPRDCSATPALPMIEEPPLAAAGRNHSSLGEDDSHDWETTTDRMKATENITATEIDKRMANLQGPKQDLSGWEPTLDKMLEIASAASVTPAEQPSLKPQIRRRV